MVGNMKGKKMSMTLVFLMLSMILAPVLDYQNSQQFESREITNEKINKSFVQSRSGVDASILAITSPRETNCVNLECTNTLKAGEATKIEGFIKNLGSSDIPELATTVSVYMADDSGNPSLLAKDAAGNDLQWQNMDVICGSAFLCEFTSLAGDSLLGGGKYQLNRYAGVPILWTPVAGNYILQVEVDTPGDIDSTNDVSEIFVLVQDQYDVQLDLTWDSGEEFEIGSGAMEWTLEVTTTGTQSFDPFDVQIQMMTFGEVSSASDSDGNSIDDVGSAIYMAGTPQSVTVYSDMSTTPPTDSIETRSVIVSSWILQGELVPNSNLENSSFGIIASLVEFKHYKQWGDCVNPNGNGSIALIDSCERIQYQSDNLTSDVATIDGYSDYFNDARISKMSIYQGFNVDGTGQARSMVSADEGGILDVGISYAYVQVDYQGSEVDSSIDWLVNFQISGPSGQQFNTDATTCSAIEPFYSTYGPLGNSQAATAQAFACIFLNLNSGEYTFDVNLTLQSGIIDANWANNEKSVTLSVENNDPMILSLDVMNEGDLFTGQETPLQMSATVFDIDEPSAAGLEYSWSWAGDELPGCERSSWSQTCTVPILDDYVTNFAVTFTVYDNNGGSTSQELMLIIWNNGGGSATTDSGITVSYAIKYYAASAFSVSATDVDLSNFENKELPGYSGTYSAVGAVDYQPSMFLQAADVLEQTIGVNVAKDLGATSLWYVSSSGHWILLSSEAEDIDSQRKEFSYEFPVDSPVLPPGELVLMGGTFSPLGIPDASITGFSAIPWASGMINLNWGVNGELLQSDYINITICLGGADCANPDTIFLGQGNFSYMYENPNAVQGGSYNVEVAVCNPIGCNTPIGTATVIADLDDRIPNTVVEIKYVNQQKSFITLGLETTGTINSTDYIMIEICKDSVDCPVPFISHEIVGTRKSYGLNLDEFLHGDEVFMSARFCNIYDCSSESRFSIVMDLEFSDDVYAVNPRAFYEIPANVSSEEAEISWGKDRSDLMYFEWEVEGTNTEIAGWKLCLMDEILTEITQSDITGGNEEYAVTCLRSGVSNTSVFWPKPNFDSYPFRELSIAPPITLHFNIMPMDEHGNGLQSPSIGELSIANPFAYTCLPQNVNNFSVTISQLGTESNYTIDIAEEIIYTANGVSIYNGQIRKPKCDVNLFDYLSENLTYEEIYNLSLIEWQDDSGTNYSKNLSSRMSVSTTWGLLQMTYNPEDSSVWFDPHADVVSLTAFESSWNKDGPVELSIVINNPSEFSLSPVIECFNENGTVPTTYSIPNGTIEPGKEVRFFVYLTLEEIRIHNLECRLIPPNELRFMYDGNQQGQSGYVNVSYVFNGIEENEKSILGAESEILPIIGFSIGGITIAAILLMVFLKIRNREKEENEDEEEDEYGAFVQSFEPQTNKISHTRESHIEPDHRTPPFEYEGEVNDDGWEICEYPKGSQIWWWKDYESESWMLWN